MLQLPLFRKRPGKISPRRLEIPCLPASSPQTKRTSVAVVHAGARALQTRCQARASKPTPEALVEAQSKKFPSPAARSPPPQFRSKHKFRSVPDRKSTRLNFSHLGISYA